MSNSVPPGAAAVSALTLGARLNAISGSIRRHELTLVHIAALRCLHERVRYFCTLFPAAAALRVEREYGLPVVLHVDDGPALGGGFVEGFVQLADVRFAVVGGLALGV